MSSGAGDALGAVIRAQTARRMHAEARLAEARKAVKDAEEAIAALDARLSALEPARTPEDAGRLAIWQMALLARCGAAREARDAALAPIAALCRDLAIEQAREDAARDLQTAQQREARALSERRAETPPAPTASTIASDRLHVMAGET